MTNGKNAFNPYLPSWEYIPDGEPYVFDGRVYVYGSHDRFYGHAYCLNDYVCWSAPVDDLGNWKYEGIIYKKTEDPENRDGSGCLFAPDVTKGPDGRYYLFYVLDKMQVVSVAVCDTPAGEYKFLGYVHHPDGTRLGEKEGDEAQFDPGVITEGDVTYMYTGFCWAHDKSRHGAMVTVLDSDMLTVIKGPDFVAPGKQYAQGTGFEDHAFFEASSIRKMGDTYYFIYSSVLLYELCYATSRDPLKGFKFQGVIVSNNDLHIDTYKPAGMPAYYGGNNHGSMVEINGRWYIFYHRHTNGTNFSRQGCAEPLDIDKNGKIAQVEMTSCGLNGGPLPGRGEYPAYIACNLFCKEEEVYVAAGAWSDNRYPRITQDGRDGDEEPGYIGNMMDSAVAGFKYFDCSGISRVKIVIRGYCKGHFEVKTAWDGPVLGKIDVSPSSLWVEHSAGIKIPDGKQALYFRYSGEGNANFKSFTLE